jgi:hypothetical protein
VAASSTTAAKGLGRGGAHGNEQVADVVFASTQDPPVQAEASHSPKVGALDITLPRHVVVIDHGNACGLLVECLQDVSFVALMLHVAASYCFVPDSQLFFDRLFL